MSLELLCKEIVRLRQEHEYNLATLTNEKEALEASKQEIAATEEAQRIVQAAAQEVQQKAHDKIAGVVSQCLTSIFDEPYQFNITFERKRGTTEAVLSFTRDGKTYNPLKEVGGGVIDVASFALRVAALVLSRPHKRRVLILDEPFKWVDRYEHTERITRIRDLLMVIAKQMGIQFIIVTHIDELKIGKVIEL